MNERHVLILCPFLYKSMVVIGMQAYQIQWKEEGGNGINILDFVILQMLLTQNYLQMKV